jgi:2-C-methyl-D-erythritol 4-phosphate cytidylyltransferase / 2-C-methyl-D-erythritol 2,4-cyclodiphosphate synthase
MSATAIIPAGGAGHRMGLNIPKQFYRLAGRPVLVHTLEAFHKVKDISEIIVVVPKDHISSTKEMVKEYDLNRVSAVIAGGKLRQDSVKAGLSRVSSNTEYVVVHDGARPLVSPGLIQSCLKAAQESGAAMAAIPVKDTLKEVDRHKIILRTIDRSILWQAQTPQVARAEQLKEAFAVSERTSFIGTDEASFLELICQPVRAVEGSEKNIKITRSEDLLIAEAILMEKEKTSAPQTFPRIGHGYDAHCFAKERKLILGGITIPHPLGLLGHSDADVLTHAFCDAILGALGEGDIGSHFPDTDPQFKNISSILLLEHVVQLAHDKGYMVSNADITIIAQKPKLAGYFPVMKENLASACNTKPEQINLKATTTEKMGFTGREEGISCHSVVLLQAL